MRKLALLIPALLVLGSGIYYIKIIGSEIALFEEFPEYDQDVIIKAHREFLSETLTGKYDDIELTEEECHEIMKQKLIARTTFPGVFR